jgi:hypothetical protein
MKNSLIARSLYCNLSSRFLSRWIEEKTEYQDKGNIKKAISRQQGDWTEAVRSWLAIPEKGKGSPHSVNTSQRTEQEEEENRRRRRTTHNMRTKRAEKIIGMMAGLHIASS